MAANLSETIPGKALDATMGKQISDSLGGLRFGIDSEGNYGYLKAGADTVTPFKTFIELGEKICDPTTFSATYALDNYAGYRNFNLNENIFWGVSGVQTTTSGSTNGNGGARTSMGFGTLSAIYTAPILTITARLNANCGNSTVNIPCAVKAWLVY